MNWKRLSRVLGSAALVLGVLTTVPGAVAQSTGGGADDVPVLEKAGGKLQHGLAPRAAKAVAGEGGAGGDELVAVEGAATGSTQALLADLEALGLVDGAAFGRQVSGRLPAGALTAAGELASLAFLRPVLAGTDVGLTTSQGDAAMRTDLLRAGFGLTGAGVTVGTLSDSYNCLGGAAADVASNDLPAGVVVLDDSACPASDEGRGMMQLIHDVAPGVAQQFHTAFTGQAAFAQGILDLAAAGSDIITDDVFYLTAPYFQDGIVAQAVDTVVGMGVPYFSSAGNAARRSYEAPFRPSGFGGCSGGSLHDFDPGAGVDVLQRVTIPVGGRARLALQWDQPFFSVSGGAGSASDIDICLFDPALNVMDFSVINNVGGDPFELVDFTNPGPGTAFDIAINVFAGPVPGLLKYIDFGRVITVNEYATNSGTVVGHAAAAGAEAVGAAFFANTPAFGVSPPLLEGFSSGGGTPILFDTAGGPVGPIVRQKPEIVAPDGTNTTFFGTDTPADADAFPNFFGTSAAAPHAAAFAALLRQASPGLTPAQVYAALEGSAIDMGPAGFDFDSGFGLVQAGAVVAVACAAPPPPPPGAIIAVPNVITLGTPGNDVIYGTAGADRIAGQGGDDLIFGLGGNDQITGGDGADTICGGDGVDSLVGGNGNDTLVGGAGNDDLSGGDGDDFLDGSGGANRIVGGPGADNCKGAAGTQFVTCEVTGP